MSKPTLDSPGSTPGAQAPGVEPGASRQDRLRDDLFILAGQIGERNTRKPQQLEQAAAFIEASLKVAGLEPKRQTYQVHGQPVSNIEVELRGHGLAHQIVVLGAHYDSAPGTPGADDNGTGTVAALELARAWAKRRPARTLRVVFFVNEEPPYFHTEDMGSLVYARRCAALGEQIVAMLSLEMLGYYDDAPGSQRYPMGLGLLYPSQGDYLGFVTRASDAALNKRAQRAFDASPQALPTQRLSAPQAVTGVSFSDHWSFWQAGYPAIMVTDTAFMRNPHYHQPTDSPQTIDYARLTRAVDGLEAVVEALVQAP